MHKTISENFKTTYSQCQPLFSRNQNNKPRISNVQNSNNRSTRRTLKVQRFSSFRNAATELYEDGRLWSRPAGRPAGRGKVLYKTYHSQFQNYRGS
jgi:hypothetical protein